MLGFFWNDEGKAFVFWIFLSVVSSLLLEGLGVKHEENEDAKIYQYRHNTQEQNTAVWELM